MKPEEEKALVIWEKAENIYNANFGRGERWPDNIFLSRFFEVLKGEIARGLRQWGEKRYREGKDEGYEKGWDDKEREALEKAEGEG
jgi:hypothetical protein